MHLDLSHFNMDAGERSHHVKPRSSIRGAEINWFILSNVIDRVEFLRGELVDDLGPYLSRNLLDSKTSV